MSSKEKTHSRHSSSDTNIKITISPPSKNSADHSTVETTNNKEADPSQEETISKNTNAEVISKKQQDDYTITKTDNGSSTINDINSGSSYNTDPSSPSSTNSVKRAVLISPGTIKLDERLGFNHRNKKIKDKPLRGVLKKKAGYSGNTLEQDEEIIVSSPLLVSTPKSVSKTLIRLYPYLIVCDRILSLVTWTSDDIWASIFMVLTYISICLYYKLVVTYLGHLLCVLLLFIYSQLDKYVGEQMEAYPTLDDIVYTVSSVSSKFDLLFSPVTVLNNDELRRLFITTLFLSPFYIVITVFFLPKEKLVLTLGVIALSYHSRYSKLARHILWRFKIVRLICVYITGLDIDGINGIKKASSYAKSSSLFATVHKKLLKSKKNGIDGEEDLSDMLKNNKPIRYTYVALREVPILLFNATMGWRWVDKGWRLDLSNDNTIDLPKTIKPTIANPKPDEGWVYYDNTWKKPSVEDTYSKYTRRRRWVRTAELIRLIPEPAVINSIKTKTSDAATPNVANVTVQVESRYNNDQTGSLHNNPELVGSKDEVVHSGYRGLDKGSSSDQGSLVNRKVSFSGTTDVRTFDEHGNYRSQKRNSVISNNSRASEQSSDRLSNVDDIGTTDQAIQDDSSDSSVQGTTVKDAYDSQRL
ncbi:unnamed protein product [Hanseniaspora opuntiae]